MSVPESQAATSIDPRARSRPSFALATLLLGALVACKGGTCAREAAELVTSNAGSAGVWWAFSGYSIAEADVDGDGALDLVGLCTEPGGEGALFVGAFDGKTFRLRWRSSSIGDPSSAYLVQLGVAAGRVVVADALGSLHVLDLANGKEVAKASLSDRAEAICTPRETPGRLWIAAKDRNESLFDPKTLAFTHAPRPASCPHLNIASAATIAMCTALPPGTAALQAECASAEVPPAIPGFIGMELAVDGTDGIVAGIKSPGSAVPMIAGFTRGAGQPPRLRWQRGVAPGSPLGAKEVPISRPALAGGRAVVTYDDLQGNHHLEAVDAATGKTLWDKETESLLRLRASPTRVYVMRWSRLDVRDATTGALLGGVGTR